MENSVEVLDVMSVYNSERGDKDGKSCETNIWCNDPFERTTEWTGKVGLIYVSDYAMSTSGGNDIDRTVCLQIQNKDNFRTNGCINNVWLESGFNTISPWYRGDTANFCVYTSSYYVWSANFCNYVGPVLPTVYLKAGVGIKKGTGTEEKPYVLGF